MPMPEGIRRRKKDPGTPSKTVTELRLFRGLYLEWRAARHPQPEVSEEREESGLPLAEIRRYTDVSVRTLTRYLRELEDCGAILQGRMHTAAGPDGPRVYCRAALPESPPELTAEDLPPHLRRLYRLCLLMRKFCRRYPGDVTELLESRRYADFFFDRDDPRDPLEHCMEEWYGQVDPGPSPRSWKRDLQTVWEALQTERENGWPEI